MYIAWLTKIIIAIKLQGAIGNLERTSPTPGKRKNVINLPYLHRKFKDAQGNQKDKTIWVECAYWTDRTGIAPYLKVERAGDAEGNSGSQNLSQK